MNGIEEKMKELEHLVKSAWEYNEKSSDLVDAYVTYELPKLLLRLECVLEELYKQIKERHRIKAGMTSVVHYTSINTLVSMLQNTQTDKDQEDDSGGKKESSLRLYDSAHFNDPDEGEYLIRTLGIQKKYKWLGERRVPHAYIASFIMPEDKNDMDDNLVFWRAYGKEGEGCSLSLPIPTNRLYKVLYGRHEVKCTGSMLLPILDRLGELLDMEDLTQHPIGERIREKFATAVWSFLERVAYLYKSDAYDYERECRFIVHVSEIDKKEIHFEHGEQYGSPARIRHYYEDNTLRVRNILISGSSIMLGPCVPYRGNVEYCLEVLLQEAGLAGPEIKISEIRYRRP